MIKLKRVLCVIAIVLSAISLVLVLIYLIGPLSSTFWIIIIMWAAPISVIYTRYIYPYRKHGTYPRVWIIIYCINCNLFLIGMFFYHIVAFPG